MAGLEEDLQELGVEGATAAAGVLSSKAEDFVNDALVEQVWAIKAVKYAETHFKLLQSRDAKTLKLTSMDDALYEQFQAKFKDLNIDVLNPAEIKSDEAKEVWRPFLNELEGKVKDFNYGTLLRLDASKDYSEENTIIVPRAQFLVIEVVRNKSGLNTVHLVSSKVGT